MHSHRTSDGAIRSRRDWNKGKKSTASLIATTFLQCLTSSISTKAGPLRPPKPRDRIEFDSSPTRVLHCGVPVHSVFHCVRVRSSYQTEPSSKSAGSVAFLLDFHIRQSKDEIAQAGLQY